MIGWIAAVAMMGAAEPRVEDLAWMAGSWSCEIWGGTFEERWSPPAGGTMQATGRHLKDGKTSFMEFISIEPVEGGITMFILLGHASKGPKTASPFRLTTLEGKSARFENPANDMPSAITYTLKPDGTLLCRLEGNEKGKPATEDFNFRKTGG